MTDPRQRRQWADHLKDEAAALQAQQDSAGGTHVPQAGPLPHSADDLDQSRRDARAAERDRCADIAQEWADPSRIDAAFPGFTAAQREAASAAATAISAAIRARR